MTPLKMLLSVAFATTALADFAQSKAPVFTTIKANAITSVKDQNRSGTCWDYATCGFLVITKYKLKKYHFANSSRTNNNLECFPLYRLECPN